MACVSEAEVLGFVRGTLDHGLRSTIEAHLDRCEECLELVTLAGRTSLAGGTPSADPASLPAIERYEIEAPIGRGAMGAVYAARDTRLGRRVAIKLVHPRLAGDEHSQIGLLREAQALARIAQPNVLTVHDVGTIDNAVFLAAELVEGDTLEVWLRTPRRWRAIVNVFVQAARGLDAVHVAGLVHRDFKPSNVLIGRDGRVRVFDFGLARFTETPSTGELAGTPLYMSPEQRRGEVADARSDQYAFCVALHEALHGVHPIFPDRRSAPASDRAPRWLRDLVRRGLAREPDRRFPAMRDVIRGLEHGLARRSRALLGGGAVLALTAAATVAMVAYTRGKDAPLAACPLTAPAGWNEARKAELAVTIAATGVPYAGTTTARVTSELSRFAARWAEHARDACIAHHASADRELYVRRTTCFDQQQLAFEAIVDRFLEVDRDGVERAPTLLGALPDVDACLRPTGPAWPSDPGERERLAAHLRGVLYVFSLAKAGKYAKAEQHVAALVGDAKRLGSRRAEADAAFLQGHVAGLQGRFDEAVERVDAALWVAEETRHDELVVAAANELISLVATRQRRPESARQYVKLARSAAERIATGRARALTARSIGNLELIAGHFEIAKQELERAVVLNGDDDPMLAAFVMLDLANLASQRGQAITSEVLIRYALSIIRTQLGELHPQYGQIMNNLANTLMDQGRHDEAAAAFDEAIAILQRSLGPEHPGLGLLYANAQAVHIARSDLPRARAMAERAVAILEQGGPPPLLASALFNLGMVSRAEGEASGAERLFARALALRVEHLNAHHPKLIEALLAVAAMTLARGDLKGARVLCERAERAIAASDVGNRAWQGALETCFGELELAAGHRARAVTLLEGALVHHASARDPGRRAYTEFVLARALPASARTRALELARSARATLATEGALFLPELEAIDRWLAHPR